MRMFWSHRLRGEDDASGWQLPYADLMSLLMAVFVMIAAMSELRGGKRFEAVAGGLRAALGFSGRAADPLVPAADREGVAGRFERMRKAALLRASEDPLASCTLVCDGASVTVCIPGGESFPAGSTQLSRSGRMAVARIAECLADGSAAVEIRGHAEGSEGVEQDPLDLSYERARAVADALAAAGVVRGRLTLSAMGDRVPPKDARQPGAGRRVEVIVHAAPRAVSLASPRKSN